MSVSSHLAINLAEYDERIRTFIPFYEEMLDIAARAVAERQPKRVVDLGIGTGALSARMLHLNRAAKVVGIDADQGMLQAARQRLPRARVELVQGSFLKAALPRADAAMASFSLHHVATPRQRLGLLTRVRLSLGQNGVFVSADCHPSAIPARARAGHRAWETFLARSYGRRKARAFLNAWAAEDFYSPLDVELGLLAKAGFAADVLWRHDAFAVIVAEPTSSRPKRRRYRSAAGTRSSSSARRQSR